MKKNRKTRIVLLLMMTAFTLLAGMNTSAKTISKKVNAPVSLSNEYYIYSGPASRITDVTSSNTKTGVIVTENDESDVNVYLKIKKTGYTNLSYKITKNGNTDTYKIRLHVYRYKNPFQTLKIGKFSYKSQFNNSDYSTLMKGKGKVQVKVKNGWQLKSVKVMFKGSSGWRDLKRGEAVDIAKKNSLQVIVKNRKYGYSISFWIWGAVG